MSGRNSPVLVLTTHHDEFIQGKLGQEIQDLLSEDVDCVKFDELEFVIHKQIDIFANGVEVGEYGEVIMYGGVSRLLRITHPLAVAFRARGIDAYTSGAESFRGLDKLSQNVLFAANNTPIPKTYFAPPNMMLEKASKVIGFPLILKDILASTGDRNYLIKDQSQLETHLGEMEEHRFIAQEYVKNDGDIRILIAASGNTFAFKKKSIEGTHLNNTSKGATVDKIGSIEGELKALCLQVLEAMGMPMLGIDVIEKDGEYFFLEANTQPQIFTGALVDDKKAFFKQTLSSQRQ